MGAKQARTISIACLVEKSYSQVNRRTFTSISAALIIPSARALPIQKKPEPSESSLLTENQIFVDRNIENKRLFLKHSADSKPTRRTIAIRSVFFASEIHFASIRNEHTAQNIQQCRFPGTILSNQADHFIPR